ncbi:hypothetical protein [Chromobacterium subtsugae]|uniref:hypothetical protein n=1 Tax=Chromobacterium subtsugae TaxID=251747 RepID=UPI0006418349|nr:hypothetical protein [Chromobacterium subtsugae]
MSTPDAGQALANLQNGRKAARFRSLLPQILAAIERGASHSQVVAALASSGLQMSLNEFRNALHRERHRKPKKKAIHAQQTQTAPTTTATPPRPGAGRFDFRQFRDQQPEDW